MTTLRLLAKLTVGVEVPVNILFGARQACFEVGTATLKARYVDGTFPQWHKVLPGKPRHVVPVVVGPFLSSARQAAAVREREGGRLMLRFEPGRVLLESRKQGAGRARVRQSLPLSGAVVEVADDIDVCAAAPQRAGDVAIDGARAVVVEAVFEQHLHWLLTLASHVFESGGTAQNLS